MSQLDLVDSKHQFIPSKIWRGICLGFNADHSPSGSNSTWTEYRMIVGVKGSRRYFTRREALIMVIRSRIDAVCDQLAMDRPHNRDIDIFVLENLANEWLTKVDTSSDIIESLISMSTAKSVNTEMMLETVSEWLGKSVSLKTVRRAYKKLGRRFTTREGFDLSDLNKIFYAVRQYTNSVP